MKYTAAFLAFAVGALAQSSVTSAPATISTPEVSPSISCVQACTPGDVNCQAACLGIARPNSSQAVETTECAAKCDQGDGTKEATDKYSNCVQSCIASLFPSSQTGSLIPGGAAASSAAASGTGANSANPTASTGTSGSGSSTSQTGSGSGSASPQATGAANSISARIGGAGLAGLLAVFAL
jgi:hypothetical protein